MDKLSMRARDTVEYVQSDSLIDDAEVIIESAKDIS